MSKKPEGRTFWFIDDALVDGEGYQRLLVKYQRRAEKGVWFSSAALAERIRLEREEELERIAHRFDQESADPRTKPHWADICRWVCSEILALKGNRPPEVPTGRVAELTALEEAKSFTGEEWESLEKMSKLPD